MQITSIRLVEGGSPIPEGGFSPPWWPAMVIPEIAYSIVVIDTDEGLQGFGPGRARLTRGGFAGEAYLRDKVLGADPALIGALTSAPEQLLQSRTPPLFYELALWDLLGKAAGLPVSKLLGAYKTQVKAYCSTGSTLAPEAQVEQAWDAYRRGYRAIKLRLHRAELRDDLAAVEAVRAALPADMAIMADANQQQNPYWSRATALSAARALEELGVLWLEEPLPMYDLDGLVELTAKVEIPIAGAENEYLLYAYRRFVDAKALDILQPDLNGCGGLLQWRQIAAYAHAHQMACIPHLWSNGLTLACILQTIASVPNAPWAECTDDVKWPASIRDRLLSRPFEICDGLIDIPQGSGWGVELDWDYVVGNARTDVRIEA